MTNVLLHGKNGRTTCEAIIAKMEDTVLIRKRVGRQFTPAPPENVGTLIRWAVPATIQAEKTFQERGAISLAFNKGEAREQLYHYNVPIPMLSETDFPIIGRPAHHRAGQGFFWCETLEDIEKARVNGATYFSQFYPKTREFRFHVGSGYILIGSEKMMPEDFDGKIFNYENGAYFRRVRWSEWSLDAVKIAIRAVKVLGLTYGAVDIMGYPTDQNFPPFVVAEVNTSPSISSDYNATLYAEYFSWLIKTSSDWVDIDAERPQDFAFRKYHRREND